MILGTDWGWGSKESPREASSTAFSTQVETSTMQQMVTEGTNVLRHTPRTGASVPAEASRRCLKER